MAELSLTLDTNGAVSSSNKLLSSIDALGTKLDRVVSSIDKVATRTLRIANTFQNMQKILTTGFNNVAKELQKFDRIAGSTSGIEKRAKNTKSAMARMLADGMVFINTTLAAEKDMWKSALKINQDYNKLRKAEMAAAHSQALKMNKAFNKAIVDGEKAKDTEIKRIQDEDIALRRVKMAADHSQALKMNKAFNKAIVADNAAYSKILLAKEAERESSFAKIRSAAHKQSIAEYASFKQAVLQIEKGVNQQMVASAAATSKRLAAAQAGATSSLNAGAQAAAVLRTVMRSTGASIGYFTAQTLVATAATWGLVAAIKSTVDEGRHFEESMARITAFMIANNEGQVGSIAAVRQQILQFARDTRYTANEAADAAQVLIRSGIGAANAMGALPAVLDLANIGQITTASSAEKLLAIMQQFHIPYVDATKTADKLSVAISKTRTSIDSLSIGLRNVGPLANQVGLSFGETAAVVAKFQEAGITASKSGTDLRRVLLNLFETTKNRSEAFKQLGIDITDGAGHIKPFIDLLDELSKKDASIRQLLRISGVRATPATLALVSQSISEVRELAKAIDEADGTAVKMSKTIEDTLNGALYRFSSAVSVLKTKLFDLQGTRLQDVFDDWAKSINEFVDQDLLRVFDRISTYLEPVFDMFYRLFTLFKNSAVGKGLIRMLGWVADGLSNLLSWLPPLAAAFSHTFIIAESGWEKISVVMDDFRSRSSDIWTSIKDLWVIGAKTAAESIRHVLQDMVDKVKSIFHGMAAFVYDVLSGIAGKASALATKIPWINKDISGRLSNMSKEFDVKSLTEKGMAALANKEEQERHDKVMKNLSEESDAALKPLLLSDTALTALSMIDKDTLEKHKEVEGMIEEYLTGRSRTPLTPQLPPPFPSPDFRELKGGLGGEELDDKQLKSFARSFDDLLTPMEKFRHEWKEIEKAVKSPEFAAAAKEFGVTVSQLETRMQENARKQLNDALERNHELFKKAQEKMWEQYEKTNPIMAGMQNSLKDYAKQAGVTAKSVEQVFTKAFKGMEDALVNFVTTGKMDFKSLADSIIADMARMVIQQQITKPLATLGSSLLSSFASSVGLGLGFSKGGAFSPAGVTAFANGGVVSTPHIFPFANGTGLMGEAGPEAIMPLSRTSSGELGVKSTGGSGQAVHINITVNAVDAPTVSRLLLGQQNVITGIVQKAFNTRGKRGPLDG